MGWYKVSFTRHGEATAELLKDYSGDNRVVFIHSNRQIMDNTVMNIEVIINSNNEQSAISDAVYKLLTKVEDAMVYETRKRFYTSLVGREPLYQYNGFEGAKEYVLQ